MICGEQDNRNMKKEEHFGQNDLDELEGGKINVTQERGKIAKQKQEVRKKFILSALLESQVKNFMSIDIY